MAVTAVAFRHLVTIVLVAIPFSQAHFAVKVVVILTSHSQRLISYRFYLDFPVLSRYSVL